MQNILAIWQREIKSYFVSPVAYVVLTVFLLLSGFFFFSYLSQVIQATMMQAQFGQSSQPIDVPGIVFKSLLQTTSVVLLFVIPMLTMGLFAEEKKRGTIELLLTTPVGHFQAIAGKYLASLTFLLILILTNIITVLPLFLYGEPDLKPMLSGYLGMFLYGITLLAVGLFISTLTENQIVAVMLTFGVSLALFVIESFSAAATGVAKSVIDYLSVMSHLEDFIKGVVDTSHIIYYVTFAFVGLFLAYRSLESMRWKN
ncbi:MAG: ABC transporter permease subunit [Acidobacteria bacterium]|nr:ABC transporter permease subunit [Acidobacteriota bacterium]